MNTNDADRRLSAWLETVAPAHEPEHLLEAVLAQTARTRRRPAWRIPERWIQMTTITTPVTSGGSARWPVAIATVLLLLALIAGAILVGGARRTAVPAPFGPASNGLLVHDLNDELISVDLATGASAAILEGAGRQVAPLFSRDGTAVAFLTPINQSASEPAEYDLRVAGVDGSSVRSLGTFTEPGGEWSPSGDQIVHESLVDGESAITIVDLASGSSRVLDLGMPAQQPSFRPSDPGQLVFRGQAPDGTWGLYLVSLDGGAPKHLDLDRGFEHDRNYAINTDYYFLWPVWSPNGRRLAYFTLEESTVDPDPGFRVRVAEIDAGGTVTAEALLAPDPAIDDESEPAWLPDGSGVVVHRVEEGKDAVVRWPIGERLDVPATPVLLDGGQFPVRFVIAPDGSQILAWRPGSPASHVRLDGGAASQTDIVLGNVVTWQRTAP